MKNLLAVMGLSMLFYSCSQDSLLSPEDQNMLNVELETVTQEFEESFKDELTPTTQKETMASAEEIEAIRDSRSNSKSWSVESLNL